ncbi:CHAD domain-containing protein [Candidatus Promineifilum breve]|nr:CHAD domain-containing protein [Candidatus Promineifilum breve]
MMPTIITPELPDPTQPVATLPIAEMSIAEMPIAEMPIAEIPIAEIPIAEAGRLLMAGELAIIQTHWPALRLAADTTAVHETRKAIRRTFTLFKLFAPYFAPDELEPHRATLRRMMRRLAPCRDAAVFRLKLAAYNETAEPPLTKLADHWDERQARADEKLREYLGRRPVIRRLDRYTRLTVSPGMGLPRGKDRAAPLLVGHALPALLFQRVGAVRAWGALLPTATPAQFHQLRIQFKELRYTLTFFEPVLSGCADLIDLSRQIQDHLGALNDASVAVELLEGMKHHHDEADRYRAFQQAELERLTAGFLPLYAAFDRPEVRRELALTLADL